MTRHLEHAAFRRRPVADSSTEQIQQRYDQHRETCSAESEYAQPLCGTTVVLHCGTCREPLFVVVKPSTWCEHAEGAWRRASAS